ncbi:MAG: MFS transporter [Anaerolineae bacterium]|nr:MFS transporter [Anaerolineae bacterium]
MTQRTTLITAFLIFISIGMASAVFGPALSTLADRVGTDLATVGVLVTTSYLGTMVGQVIAGPLNDRLGQRPVLLVGIVLAAIGTLVIVLTHALGIMIAGSAVFGLGFGALDVSTNLLIAQRFAEHSVSVLNLLHVFFGVGAVIGPAIASLALNTTDSAMPAFWISIGVFLLPIPLVLRMPRGPLEKKKKNDDAPEMPFSYRVPLLWLLGAILLLYVGVEAGLGAWITAYVDRSTSLGEDTGAQFTAMFWGALTVGRVLGAVYGGRFTPFAVLRVSLIGMACGSVLLALGTGSVALTVLAVLIIGVWAGPPFPTVIAITTAAFTRHPGKATSIVVTLASLGASTMPWLTGVLLDRVSPNAMAIFVVIESIAMLGVYVLTRREFDRRTAALRDATLTPAQVVAK